MISGSHIEPFIKLFYWITSYWKLSQALYATSTFHHDLDKSSVCAHLHRSLDLSKFNATVLGSSYHDAGNTPDVPTSGSCGNPISNSVPLCRVQVIVNTSERSSVSAETWLPTNWSGRSLVVGNGGFEGCIKYGDLAYGASLGFAATGTNNGHDGDTGEFFLNNTEVLSDFTNRSIPIAASLGRHIAQVYYEHAPTHSYYIGCSMGGRQGVYSALHNPADFDGILVGAPALNMIRLIGWSGLIARYFGAPHPENSSNRISPELWNTVSIEIRRQCDKLDGVEDGIISNPDACDFRPEELLCDGELDGSECLTIAQVAALRKLYKPLYGLEGELMIPRFDPGAEISVTAREVILSGVPNLYLDHWMKYVVYNDPNYDYSNFGLSDIYIAQEQDPSQISTYDGNLSAFRDRGGKILSYHGYEDEYISSGNSKEYYNLVSRTLRLHSDRMDEFYRLFFAPGLGHCSGGHGAVRFGQNARSIPPPDTSADKSYMRIAKRSQKADNMLLALVDWVEGGKAPDTITGVSDDGEYFREHCRYPQKSVWSGTRYTCV